jgi:leader peptidase (prepilin peptidase) / N-methyltransferase
MGFGDVTLMGMIGAFLGWRAAILTFFIGPFFGLGHALWKFLKFIKKKLAGGQLTSADRELPYGPYLSMAAATLLFLGPWLGEDGARGLFDTFYVIFWWLLNVNVDLPK